MDTFNGDKRRLNPYQNDGSVGTFTWSHNDVTINLEYQTIQNLYCKAMDTPLKEAKRWLQEFAASGCEHPQIFVTGGTAKNPGVQSSIRAMCSSFKLPTPKFTAMFREVKYW